MIGTPRKKTGPIIVADKDEGRYGRLPHFAPLSSPGARGSSTRVVRVLSDRIVSLIFRQARGS
jgi:hypothetical protein